MAESVLRSADRELSKVRHAYNDLISKEMDASELAKQLQRQLESKDKSLQQQSSNAQLLEEELQSLRERDKALSEELSTLRRDNQRCRAAEASHELARTQQESKTEEIEKKASDLYSKFIKCQEQLLETEKELQQATMRCENRHILEGRVESLRGTLYHQLIYRITGERAVRQAAGLPPRGFGRLFPKHKDTSEVNGVASAPFSSVSRNMAGFDDEPQQDLELLEELQWFVKRRALMGWREQSARLGTGLVHAICLWGWRRALECAGDLADLVELQLKRTNTKAEVDGIISVDNSGACSSLNGATMASLFAAKHALALARGFMADFPAHSPAHAWKGSLYPYQYCRFPR